MSTFSDDSHMTYWSEWAVGVDPTQMGPLLSKQRMWIFNLASTALSIAFLLWLDFKVWAKF